MALHVARAQMHRRRIGVYRRSANRQSASWRISRIYRHNQVMIGSPTRQDRAEPSPHSWTTMRFAAVVRGESHADFPGRPSIAQPIGRCSRFACRVVVFDNPIYDGIRGDRICRGRMSCGLWDCLPTGDDHGCIENPSDPCRAVAGVRSLPNAALLADAWCFATRLDCRVRTQQIESLSRPRRGGA